MNHNSSIGCTVEECKYHCKDDNFCTLDSIQVGKNTAQAKEVKATDCNSFELGK
ncbi:MAG: DUF1540 domain-containing protein [Clostridium sp.]|uniref:DUF1540 domain-containing protein n=1 Tax=Clostridium sp. TaxID=1506 RepID=UPI002FC817BF